MPGNSRKPIKARFLCTTCNVHMKHVHMHARTGAWEPADFLLSLEPVSFSALKIRNGTILY